ncbi:MAG: cell division protein ZapA [Acidobacteria bacterium]|nr:cell division protein ZapA [Acidobacteriota bacterium]
MATATKHRPVHEANNSNVRVEIFDQAYNLRGTDPDYILKLAEYVDLKMRAVAEQTQTVDSARLAVLAALNIADEYHLLKTKLDGRLEASQRARKLLEALDEVLKDGRHSL